MAIIKCKMCGGDLNITAGETVAECEYCGTRQTVPSMDSEKKLNLFARANRLRAGCEFDKASGLYESIVADFPEEAEAYWGLVLCKYGIEYVDDPGSGKKVPTCHRSSFESVLDDANLELALEYADPLARRIYREEARQIEQLRKGIIEVSGKEAPYDIFLCYKETAENGERTLDSVLAQDVYDALTAKGYRVFFSRITLEDKLGQEYEPYIFAALNSAKIMLAFGTDYEYFNAVWVKNEWSRFLQLMIQDKSKYLIPCYKNISAYDMPKEFTRLQAQDLGKIGALQDLLRSIDKLMQREETILVIPPSGIPDTQSSAYAPQKAKSPKKGKLLKLLASLAAVFLVALLIVALPFVLYEHALGLVEQGQHTAAIPVFQALGDYKNSPEQLSLCQSYSEAMALLGQGQYAAAASLFETLADYSDSPQHLAQCHNSTMQLRYNEAISLMNSGNYTEAAAIFTELQNFADSAAHRQYCEDALGLAKAQQYSSAISLMQSGEYAQALAIFEELGEFQDCQALAAECQTGIQYAQAMDLMDQGSYAEAVILFQDISSFRDSQEKIQQCEWGMQYQEALALMEKECYEEAFSILEELIWVMDIQDTYVACRDAILELQYQEALALMDSRNYQQALEIFLELDSYRESAAMASECERQIEAAKPKKFSIQFQVTDYAPGGSYATIDASRGYVSYYALLRPNQVIYNVRVYEEDANSGGYGSLMGKLEQINADTTFLIRLHFPNDITGFYLSFTDASGNSYRYYMSEDMSGMGNPVTFSRQ